MICGKHLQQDTMSPWNEIGTIEVALDETQHKTLEKYHKWGLQNGVSENNLSLLNSNELKQNRKKSLNVILDYYVKVMYQLIILS